MLRPIIKDDQKAFEYAIYMMVGSCFKSAKATQENQEANRRILYGEQKNDDQYWMENRCERFISDSLSKMPKALWKEEVKVTFIPIRGTNVSEIRFSGERYILRIAGSRQKRQIDFLEPELYKKSS